MTKEKQIISKGLDVSEQVQKAWELESSPNDKEEDQGNELREVMTTQKFWINYSDEVKKFIEENDKVFFCYWNDEIGEIHSLETMFKEFEGSNLFPTENTLISYVRSSRNSIDNIDPHNERFDSYDDFISLLKWCVVEEVNKEDNMTIVRIK